MLDTLSPMANSTESTRSTSLMGKSFSLAGSALKVGEKAPDFEVIDSSLQPVNLAKTGKEVRIFSVVPSLDTPVCDSQTKRFEDEVSKLDGVKVLTISMDLPFAQKRWCGNFGINHVGMLSDHKTASFGEKYGTLISDLRIESRAIFVLDPDDTLQHVEYVKEVGSHPDYEAALKAAREALPKK
jgi:thiol peroxidase